MANVIMKSSEACSDTKFDAITETERVFWNRNWMRGTFVSNTNFLSLRSKAEKPGSGRANTCKLSGGSARF